MAEWIGNLFLTAGSGITLTKPDTQGHGGTTISANAGTGPSVWSSATAYVAGDLVIDRGGFWECVSPNTNSEPISGNANWTLVGGTPYVRVIVTPPEYNLLDTVQVPIVPAPTSGMLFPTAMIVQTSDGTLPSETSSDGIVWDGGAADGSDGLQFGEPIFPNVPPGVQWGFFADNPTEPAFASALNLDGKGLFWKANLAITGGTVVYCITLFYQIIPPVTFPNVFFIITAVNQGTKTFTVTGDASGLGATFSVVGNTGGNNGTYTKVSATFGGVSTDVVVVEAIPSATADGWIKQV